MSQGSAAKIVMTVTPSEFDLLRAELAVNAERLRAFVNDREMPARERSEAREREARIRELLAKIG